MQFQPNFITKTNRLVLDRKIYMEELQHDNGKRRFLSWGFFVRLGFVNYLMFFFFYTKETFDIALADGAEIFNVTV